MTEEPVYTQSQVLGILANLVNGIGLCAKGENMPARYKQKMCVEGQDHWVTGATLKDLLENYLQLCIKEGTVMPGFLAKISEAPSSPLTGVYLDQFVSLYKNDQGSNTKENRDRTIRNHIKPRFEKVPISDITVNQIQEWFNELTDKDYSHETLLKIKNTFSPCLDAAVEDGYLKQNPFKSTRLTIGGTATKHHKAIPADLMKTVRTAIPGIQDERIRFMLVLLAYTGMRMEEVLGLKWEDIDFIENWIYIQRAVVHPKRNVPEIKLPKSKSSTRRIPLPEAVKKALKPKQKNGFLLFSGSKERPLSYTEARRVFDKIRNQFGLSEYSAHDFRDTCATEWREAGIPTDVIAQLLGHSKSDITENRYVKYRDEIFQGVRAVMNNQNGTKS